MNSSNSRSNINNVRESEKSALATKFFGAPMIPDTIVAQVDLSETSDLVPEYAEALSQECDRLMGAKLQVNETYLDATIIGKYLRTSLWIRVQIVNSTLRSEYKACADIGSIPIFWGGLLAMVGIAFDDVHNIEFTPAFKIKDNDLLSPSEYLQVSRKLKALETLGFKQVFGQLRKKEGDLGFMAMSYVNGTFVSYRRDHPVMAFYASFFKMVSLETVTGLRPRVVYGHETLIKSYLDALI